jgi:hypothetical protein
MNREDSRVHDSTGTGCGWTFFDSSHRLMVLRGQSPINRFYGDVPYFGYVGTLSPFFP